MKKRVLGLLTSIVVIFGIITGMPNNEISAANAIYWPVPGHTNKENNFHNGNAIDIRDSSINGSDVIAACGGKVAAIFLCPDQHYGSDGDCHGFGTGLVINGDDGRVYQYAHMQANSIPEGVYYGASVSAGQNIGKVGTTGNSSGYHLHFGISLEKYWNKSGINPYNENYIYVTPDPPHIHDYTSAITKQPTCTEAGVKTNTCPCGDTYTEAIPATGHKYLIEEVDPTLESEGYSIYTCEVCGDTYKDNIIPQIVIGEDGWYYTERLPKDISDSDYEIQYQHSYQKKATSSPGKDWVKGELAESGYIFVGEPFTTAKQVATSDTLVMTDYYFYHYCGGSAGAEANYEQTDKFVHYDYIRPEHQVVVQSTGMDGEYPYFVLGWANDNSTVFCLSGTTCDGSAGAHGTRSKAWYRMATYQNRQLANYYYYSKQSDWEADEDSAASVVTYRYRPNNTGMMGDVNSDGEFNVVDVVLLQKWLLTVPDVKLADSTHLSNHLSSVQITLHLSSCSGGRVRE